MTLEEIFNQAEGGALTYAQFQEATRNANIKLADLSTGAYVSRSKYDDDLSAKTNEISSLNAIISRNATELNTLNGQLEAAGNDSAKLAQITKDFNALQAKNAKDLEDFQSQLLKQRYEFAVKEYANSKTFTSNAAKRDFTTEMIAKGLQMEGDKILGAEDFMNYYKESNPDAFVAEHKEEPAQQPKPRFVDTVGNGNNKVDENPFKFNFQTVRPMSKKE